MRFAAVSHVTIRVSRSARSPDASLSSKSRRTGVATSSVFLAIASAEQERTLSGFAEIM